MPVNIGRLEYPKRIAVFRDPFFREGESVIFPTGLLLHRVKAELIVFIRIFGVGGDRSGGRIVLQGTARRGIAFHEVQIPDRAYPPEVPLPVACQDDIVAVVDRQGAERTGKTV